MGPRDPTPSMKLTLRPSFSAFAACLGLAALPCELSAAGISQFGVLDTSGINPQTGLEWAPGDTYRLIFVTSTTTTATSTDISTYNAFVQGVADGAGLGTGVSGPVNWNAVGSTATVDAIDNTGTAGPGGSPILLMDGMTIIATDNADLWDGILATIVGAGPPSGTGPLTGDLTVDHARGIHITESGALLNPPPEGADDRVFTGTNGDGTASGEPLGAVGNVSTGSTGSGFGAQFWGVNGSGETTRWTQDFSFDGTGQQQMYAISDTLTVVPEPSTVLLALLGGVALIRRRR